jgi:hypothetical protein
MEPMVLVLPGGPGADSLTLGRTLAAELGWSLVEAADGQPSARTRKLRRGQSRTSAERAAWMGGVRATIERLVDRREHAVIVCGPLEEAECLTLRAGLKTLRFVHLIPAASPARAEVGRDTPADTPRSVSSELHHPTPDGIRIGVPRDLASAKDLSSIVRGVRLEFGL